jgi:hypothetical protein
MDDNEQKSDRKGVRPMNNDKSACALVKALDRFVCEVSCLDRIWNVFFPDRAGKWRQLHVQQYKDSHYLTRVGDEARSLEVVRGKRVRVAEDMGWASRSWNGKAASMPWPAMTPASSGSCAAWGFRMRSRPLSSCGCAAMES